MAATYEVIEGFDHVGSAATTMARLADKGGDGITGWHGAGLTSTLVFPVTGRAGQGLAMQFGTSETGSNPVDFRLSADIEDNDSTRHVCGGFAFRLGFQPYELANAHPLLRFLDSAGTERNSIELTVQGRIQGLRQGRNMPGVFATSISSESNPGYTQYRQLAHPIIREGEWHYLSYDFEVGRNSMSSGFAGDMMIWLDGMLVAHTLNGDTWGSSNNLRDLRLTKLESIGTFDVDDFWCAQYDWADGTGWIGPYTLNPGPHGGSVMSGIIHMPQVRTRFPTGDGNQNDMAVMPTSLTANFQAVDDNPENSDTDYVTSSTTNDTELYTFPGVEADVRRVHATAVSFTAREDGTGTHTVGARTRHSTNESTYGSSDVSNTSYETKHERARRNNGSTPSNITVTLTNPGAESETGAAPLTGWEIPRDQRGLKIFNNGWDGEEGLGYLSTSASGMGSESSGTPPGSVTAGGGSNWFYFDGQAITGPATLALEQRRATSTDSIPDEDIDAGILQAVIGGDSYVADNNAALFLSFYDEKERHIYTAWDTFTGASWTTRSMTVHIPPGTRFIGWGIGSYRSTASSAVTNVYWDLITASVQYLSADDEFTTTEIDAAEFGVIKLS